MTDSLQPFLDVRNKAFANLDIEWARSMLPEGTSDEMLLVSLHKARAECTAMSDELRDESRTWLTARGLHPGINP
jgi:hypothetical protein